ncbi:MAG: hypothetical protein K8S98_07640 [Planctomycetes bacterium]|nr:hypothetical protein [Planctomycetota bacterium]
MSSWKKAVAALVLIIPVAVLVLKWPSAHITRANLMSEVETPGDHGPATARLLEAQRPNADTRLACIQTELGDLGRHEWAGVYGWDDGEGNSARLSIAPKMGFTYFRSTHEGTVDLNHGSVVAVEPGRIQVEPAIDPEQNLRRTFGVRSFAPLDVDLFPIRWGERRYLIAKSEMRAFCNAVNSGREALTPRFAHRLDVKESSAPTGSPEVLDAYREWLLPARVDAELVQIVKPDEPASPEGTASRIALPLTAMINVGRERGLVPGMIFWLTDAKGYDGGEVLECDAHSAKLVFRLDLRYVRTTERLQVGWKVSTRASTD